MDVYKGLVRYVVTVQSKSRELTQEGSIMHTSRATKLEMSVRPKWRTKILTPTGRKRQI